MKKPRFEALRMVAINLLMSPQLEAMNLVNEALRLLGSDLRVRDARAERRTFERHKAHLDGILDEGIRRGRRLDQVLSSLTQLDVLLSEDLRTGRHRQTDTVIAARRILDEALGRIETVKA